ncbi:MAG TPA: gamma-glutamyltransferase, partial [Gemmatimonadaceae bacterium]
MRDSQLVSGLYRRRSTPRPIPYALALALFLPVAMTSASAQAPTNPLPIPGRSVVTTSLGIVAASQPLAAKAGAEILDRGGNAIDAAIAANAVLGLVEPHMNGVGGDLFAIVYEASTGKLHGLNASGWAPSGLTPQLLAERGLTRMPNNGIFAVTVPGAVAGWDALRSRFGTMPFTELLSSAIWYAENGFPVSEVIAGEWAEAERKLSATPEARATYFLGDRPPRFGEVFRNGNLAATLRRIAAHGRDGFYRGQTADAIIELSRTAGGTMTHADLSEFEVQWQEPIKTTYRGWTVYELPPQGQGIAALMMLNIMERYPLGEWGFHDPRAMHVMIEAKKLAYADMLAYVGDPAFSTVPVQQLLSREHAATRAARLDLTKAACDVMPGRIAGLEGVHGGDTIYLTVIDAEGNIVSLIQSIYSSFGTGLVPSKMGFALHNRGALFTLDAGHPNTLAPRKRPLHTIIPAFMEKDGVRIGFGIMGGWTQSQAHAQFVSNIADYGMTIQQALEAGRFVKNSFRGCDVSIEALVPAATQSALRALGHEIRVVAPRSDTFGRGQAVMSLPNGVHFGASEPRHDGAAIPQGAVRKN